MKLKHKQAYMETAEVFAKCSVGKRLKVGAVIVKDNRIISCGYNAHPKHIDGPLEDDQNVTLPTVRHAEKSALMGLLRAGISPIGASMFITHACCRDCAIDVVDSGISNVYYKTDYRSSEGIEYLKKNNVQVEKFDENGVQLLQQHGVTVEKYQP
jgi:dCMP deaminase